MNLIDFLLVLAMAMVCGSIFQLTSGYSRGGWVVNLMMGFLGAAAGVFVSRALDAPVLYDLRVGDVKFPVVYGLIGSVLLLAAISLLVRPRR